MSILLDNVYGGVGVVLPSTDNLVRLVAAQKPSNRDGAESEGSSQIGGNRSQAASHRTLQKNYLQNLGELVKIHREMKRTNQI
jgi:hypothetical protein